MRRSFESAAPRTDARSAGAAARAAVLGIAVLSLLAGCDPDPPCCAPPLTETDVAFGWTIDGASPAVECAAVGATTVRLEVLAADPTPQRTDAPCAAGAATVRATVFLPAPGSSSAGAAIARLLDAGGAELSARRTPLVWSGDAVSAIVPLVTPRTAGALRYRWCQPLPDASQLLVQADGPMWAETIATAGMIEVLFPARASGSYRLSATTILGSPLVAVRDTFATVVAGGETVVSVAPCLPVP